MIGAVLGFAKPKIDEIQDKLIIDQTFEAMKEVDAVVSTVVNGGSGNKRVIDIEIKKGLIEINPEDNQIVFTIEESKMVYSQIGTTITQDNIKILTTETGSTNTVTLTLDYDSLYDIETGEGDILKLTKSPTPYKLSITNNGDLGIEIKEIS
jgi:hypothetical protein